MKRVVITGVSSGIGWGTAKVLIANQFQVFGSVRKPQDAERLSAEFGSNFTPLLMDVTDENAVKRAADQVRAQLGGETLFGLVNNAGIAIGGPLLYQPLQDFRRQLEVNLTSVVTMVQSFGPLLGVDRTLKGKPGRIINVSSVGGQIGPPFLAGYAASKHGVEGLSESLRRELMLFGIDVIIVGPGSVATPIWDKAEQFDVSLYKDTEYAQAAQDFRQYMVEDGHKGWPPERIGEVILEALTTARPLVRYAAMPGYFSNWIVPRLLPRRWIDRFIARNLRLIKQ